MRKNRSKELLDHFVKYSNQAFSVKELSGIFGISERQIKNYIKQLNETAAPKEMLLSGAGGVFQIRKDYDTLMHLYERPEFSPKERSSLILSKLLANREPLNLFDLCDELYVSRPTIEADVKRIKKMVQPFRVSLSISGDMLSINGTEKAFRKLTSFMISNTEYKGFLVENEHLFLREDYQVDFIKQNLVSIFKACNFLFNDYSLNNIILHLVIAIDRLKNHYYIEEDKLDVDVSAAEVQAATMVSNFLEEHFHVEYSELERRNLAIFLSCNLATVDYKTVNPERIEHFLMDGSAALTRSIISKITDHYYLDPFDDIFFARFALHINNLMKRLRSGFSSHNPMCQDIQKAYPLIYDIAVYAATLIREETGYQINEDEISLIALHIGSFIENNQANKNKLTAIYVYADYHGFYQANVSILQQKFSDQLNLQYSISALDYKNSSLEADMIISEVSFEHAILVSPFITSGQILQIGEVILTKSREREVDNFDISLKSMFTRDLFFSNVCGVTKQDVILKLGDRLKEKGYIDDVFLESVFMRENMSSTCFTPGIAIPHAISQNVKKSFISITRYDKPQAWDDKHVLLVIFIGISYPDRKTFRQVFNHLVRLFDQMATIQAIAECTGYDEIVEIIHRLYT